MMQLEQKLLGDWKVEKIVEAAGSGFDAENARQELLTLAGERPIVLFSFVDCPWCLAAKKLLVDELNLDEDALRVHELEDLGRRGKTIRAAIALATGRTSLPACFLGGQALGGFTDGFDGFAEDFLGDEELCLESSPGLLELHRDGRLRRMLAELGVNTVQML